uniref:hypothetical protein n=1 Tax=Streptomyces sp. WAC05458 TaxID=2487412 RepID=UPI0021B0129E|nr:hypothetical protein [Streptomyces sp. WAC05458]
MATSPSASFAISTQSLYASLAVAFTHFTPEIESARTPFSCAATGTVLPSTELRQAAVGPGVNASPVPALLRIHALMKFHSPGIGGDRSGPDLPPVSLERGHLFCLLASFGAAEESPLGAPGDWSKMASPSPWRILAAVHRDRQAMETGVSVEHFPADRGE